MFAWSNFSVRRRDEFESDSLLQWSYYADKRFLEPCLYQVIESENIEVIVWDNTKSDTTAYNKRIIRVVQDFFGDWLHQNMQLSSKAPELHDSKRMDQKPTRGLAIHLQWERCERQGSSPSDFSDFYVKKGYRALFA